MRKLAATLCLTIAVLLAVPPQTFAGVNDTYICEQKKENIAGYKKRHILYWKQNSITTKDKVEKGSVDTSKTTPLLVNNPNYFVSIYPYREGHSISSFDGRTFTTHYIAPNYTYVTEYFCEKF